MIKKITVAAFLLGFILSPLSAMAQADLDIIGGVDKRVFSVVEDLLKIPEDKIDFVKTKLIIDQIIDPSISIFKEESRIARIVGEIEKLGGSHNEEKLDALRRYLYTPGAWNKHEAFAYDFDDPLGRKIENKLLSNYLTSKKGNCISMPFLFIVLGQKLGLDVVASNAPLHIFVKYTDDASKQTINLETTSGANPARDEWYKKQFPMSEKSLSSGIYLKKLTKKETVSEMATTLLEHFQHQGEFGTVILLSQLLLSHDSRNISARVHLASAHNALLKKYGLWNYHRPQDVPQNKKYLFDYLVPRINWYHREAEKLGWRPLTQKENEDYLNAVEKQAVK